MKASKALRTAAGMVDGSRSRAHGVDKGRSFDHVAAVWSAFLGVPITGEQVCWCMTMLKAVRSQNGMPLPDHYTDAAGYAALAGEVRLGGKK